MNRYGKKILLVSGLAAIMAACSSNEPKTLASLQYEVPQKQVISELPQVVPQISHEQVRQEYKELLTIFEEERLKEQIERRIADVYMMEGVYNQNKGKEQEGYYNEATRAYKEILEKYPNSPANAEVLYQLSKAYDIEGKQDQALNMLERLVVEHPNYKGISEAQFRKGDIHFSSQDYRSAEFAYNAVIRGGNEKLLLNAYYMLGWSRYKQLKYTQSVNAFSYVLSQLLANKEDLSTLSKGQKPLAEDTVNSISLGLDKLGGAEKITDFDTLADQSYSWMIYDNLGQYYFSKDLYEDSASSYRLFVNKYNNSDRAPDLHNSLIDTYTKGGFAKQALAEKATYVDAYGLGSPYASSRSGFTETVATSLKTYMDELASHYHSEGQLFQSQIAQLENTDSNQSGWEKQREKLYARSINSFDQAAGFYQRYINTFPQDEQVDEIRFLKAETLFSSYQYPQAIVDYELVAYQPIGLSAKDKANEAGYAAVLSYQQHLEFLRKGSLYPGQPVQPAQDDASLVIQQWKGKAVESMLRFVSAFSADDRSPQVWLTAGEYLYSLKQYPRTVEVLEAMIAAKANADVSLRKSAYGLMAQSYFNLNDFQQAEDNFLNQRNLIALNTPEYNQVTEQLATSIYKKSEVIIESGDKASAITQLLKMKELTPNSPIRITAQYDAASLLLDQQRWSEAIIELQELQSLYPNYELAPEYPRKLAFAYEKNGDWQQAASTYLYLADTDTDAEIKQEALFLAATMFEKDENYAAAIDNFIRYTKSYKQPFDTYMEALYGAAINNERLGKISERNKWLAQIIQADKNAGSNMNNRSRWLAAWSNAKFGDFYADRFNATKLSLPIVKSIPEKNKWLQESIEYYQVAADYGILEFVAMSSYKIGVLYRQFAGDLRNSPVPQNLSVENQATYTAIIEEQATPFDQLAIDVHQANLERAWAGQFNPWINKSFVEMAILIPERFKKEELIVSYGDGLR